MAARTHGSQPTVARKEEFMRASQAAVAMRRGDPGPGRAFLADWRFSHDLAMMDTALSVARSPCTDTSAAPVSSEEILAWRLVELAGWARWLRQGERAWDQSSPPDPRMDAEAGAAWANLFEGRPFGASTYLSRHLLPAAARVFRSVMVAAELPEFEIRRVQRDLSEGFLSLLVAERKGVPVWLDLGIRLLERGPRGPVAALAMHVTSWGTAARCLSRRRSWNDTLCTLWPDLTGSEVRALRLRDQLERSADGLVEVLDLHLLCPSVSMSRETPPLHQSRNRAVSEHDHEHRDIP